MTAAERRSPRRRGPAPGKQQAILDASLSIFADLGYVGASIEIIAARAAVSTRTIYNHFDNKATLFQTTIERSAARVAEAQTAIIERYLGAPDQIDQDLEGLLVAFASEWIRPLPDYAEHRAVVERVRSEVGRIPPEAIDAWQRAGPLRVRRALSRAFAGLASRGLLRVDDPDVAALHFTRLVNTTDPLHPGRRTTGKRTTAMITDGVHAFLYGYAGA